MVAKIKFCGIMQGQDAAAAVEAGAAYLGVVFAGGPMAVSEGQAREVVAAATEVPVQRCLADQSPDEILRIAEVCAPAGAQPPRPLLSGRRRTPEKPRAGHSNSGSIGSGSNEHRPGIEDPHKMKQLTEAVVAHSTVT